MKRMWVVLILVLAFFGLADAAYLAQSALSNTPLLCNLQNLSDCNVVAASEYSRIFGIPLAVYGVVFYGVMFVLASLELVLYDKALRRVLQAGALIGVASSLYFVFVQKFFIGAFCIYCFVSAVIAFGILFCASRIEPIRTRTDGTPPTSGAAKGEGRTVPAKTGLAAHLRSGGSIMRAAFRMPPDA